MPWYPLHGENPKWGLGKNKLSGRPGPLREVTKNHHRGLQVSKVSSTLSLQKLSNLSFGHYLQMSVDVVIEDSMMKMKDIYHIT